MLEAFLACFHLDAIIPNHPAHLGVAFWIPITVEQSGYTVEEQHKSGKKKPNSRRMEKENSSLKLFEHVIRGVPSVNHAWQYY